VSTSSALSTFRRLGLGGMGGKPFSGLDLFDGLASGWSALALLAAVAVFVDGISSHVSFPISFCRRKKGHNLTSIPNDSLASAAETGTGEDLMTAWATSDMGKALRFRVIGDAVVLVEGAENILPSKRLANVA